jgi:membrane protease YdiL (CAAX protease family)
MLSAKPWRGEAVLQLLGAQLLCFCLAAMIAGLLQKAGLAAFQAPDGVGAALLSMLGFQGAAWLLIWFFLRQHRVGWREALGWRGPDLKKSLWLALGVLAFTLPAVWLLQILSGAVLHQIGVPIENQRAVGIFLDIKSFWLRAVFGFVTVVIVPVAEEFVFRGILYPFVKQLGSPRAAFFGVSAVFAAIHLDAGTFAPLFVLALLLTWLYEKTDNLLAPITAHSLFNAINLVALCFLPQIDEFLRKLLPPQLLK